MNNAAALHELNRALAHFRRRQGHDAHTALRTEIAQLSKFAEYPYGSHTLSQCESVAQDARTQSLDRQAA